jgi:hypothetical protein
MRRAITCRDGPPEGVVPGAPSETSGHRLRQSPLRHQNGLHRWEPLLVGVRLPARPPGSAGRPAEHRGEKDTAMSDNKIALTASAHRIPTDSALRRRGGSAGRDGDTEPIGSRQRLHLPPWRCGAVPGELMHGRVAGGGARRDPDELLEASAGGRSSYARARVGPATAPYRPPGPCGPRTVRTGPGPQVGTWSRPGRRRRSGSFRPP